MAKNKDAKRVIILDGKKNESRNNEGKNEAAGNAGSIMGDTEADPGYIDALTGMAIRKIAELENDPEDEGTAGPIAGYGTGRRRAEKKKKKKTVRTKLLIFLTVSVIILITAVIGAVRTVNNNFRTPVRIYEEYLNKPEFTGEELSEAYGNHVAEKQFERLRTLLSGYEDYKKSLDASLLKSRDIYRENCERYGDDFRYKVTVDGMEKLNPIQAAALQTELNGILNDIDASGMVRSADPELREAVHDVTTALKKPGITGGYRVFCTQSVTGSKEDGPVSGIQEHTEIIVVRLNGRWIMWDGIYDILKMSF